MGLFRQRARTMPVGMETWAPLGYVTLEAGHVQRPDLHTDVPKTMFGDVRRHPGLQLRNGVSQLSARFDVPTASGVPYFQVQAARNPDHYMRFGGSPSTPAVKAVIDQAKQDHYAGQDIDGNGPLVRLGRLTRRARS